MALERRVKTGLVNNQANVLFQTVFGAGTFLAGHVFATIDVRKTGDGLWHNALVAQVGFNAISDSSSEQKEVFGVAPPCVLCNKGSLSATFSLVSHDGMLDFCVTPASDAVDPDIRITYYYMNENFQTVAFP